MVESNAVPGFLPSSRGLPFANTFPPGPTVRFGPLDPRWVGIGDASAGLCGGMVVYVRDRFRDGRPVPPEPAPPANGTPLFRTLVREQVRSLDWFWTPIRFWWLGAIDPARAARRALTTELPRIRFDIDAGRLVRLGLIRHHGLNPMRLSGSHQVLAFAYETAGASTTLRIYDPNWPGRDDVTITLDATGPHQSTGEALAGLFRIA